MKKILAVVLLIICFQAKAQEESFVKNQNRHEFRIDALEALAIPNLEINYEYVISRYSGAGIATSFSFDDDHKEYQSFAIEPYYRQYFFNNKDFGARGFFVEGLLRFAGGEEEIINIANNSRTTEDWTNVGIGVVLGQKWVSDNGFVFEISLGGGRYLSDDTFSPEGFVRGGILVGYRFF
ncbi:DUF3575 domain-containing protein [Aquimarina sp. D1M17]|uniref:DUF3575 domain-containing protein n=1 Tax=Aquimarina acroporae TaxID=2937283 RepID=UPI0020BD7680|nr:DUF3575 domain-containing protein [Aquimarina acroporae]MCK8522705.1 DUF3575 domain-containing protein [Aquimarina acroporae]